jgi:flagellar M-ring protein FliF
MEEDYSQRIESLLTPLLGPGRVRAQVVAQIEMASTEEAREQYRPDSQIVRSEQTTEESSRSGADAQGVPGALTNQPPEGGKALPAGAAPTDNAAAATGAAAAGAAVAAGPPDNSSRQATRNYEIDRTVAYTRQPAGRLQRLSVAVLIDNLRTTAADGKVTESPLTEEQVGRINTLVRDAVGFDEARGDRVSVVNQSFLPEAALVVPEMDAVPIWEKPLVRDIIKLVSGLVIVVLLLLFVLKPLIRSLTAAARAAMEPAAVPAGAAASGAASPGAISGPGHAIAYEQQIAQARSIVAKDPARVAQVVKGWVEKDE